MPETSQQTRVAILGGGPAALAAAFELTATPDLQRRHEITIYQPGWRPGGKCASGRNKALGDRIEEHGLHVWFGCYDNAFSIMRRCYASLGRDKRTQALPTWRHAFKPCNHVAVWDRGEDWTRHVLEFPPTPVEPGTEREREFVDVVREVLGWIERRMRKLQAEDDEVAAAVEAAPSLGADKVQRACQDVGIEVQRREHLGIALLIEAAAQHAERHLVHGAIKDFETFAGLLAGFNGWVSKHLADPLPDHADIRFLAGTVDVVVAALTGILADGLLLKGFDAINDEELSDWLARHGASIDKEHPDRNPVFLRGVYDGSFAFEEGDPLRPNMAAGRALQGAIRCLFHYNGAVLWRMQAGMGDAVIAPLYEVLRARGVSFRFFHAVNDVLPTNDGRRVSAIDIVRQVETHGDYEPLIEVLHDGKPLPCWPDRPDFKQLVNGGSQKVRRADFEHEIDPFGRGVTTTLVAGKDFDVAILAVPPPVQKEEICKKLLKRSPRYAAMLDGVDTVYTQAAQIWLDRTPQELGQGWASNSLMSMFVEPLDTYCDMSHLLAGENWPKRLDVRHIAYFCGVIPHKEVGGDPAHPDLADEAVHRHTRSFLEDHARRFWPNAAAPPRQQGGFDWARLVTAEAPTATDRPQGTTRLKSQYLRVNHQLTERYVLTLAGSIQSRLWPSERCFDNLVFAGDWTRNGFDAGCVEAAMTSGMLAAEEISGWPKQKTIAGLDGPTGFPNRPLGSENGGGLLPLVGWAERVVTGAREVASRLVRIVR